MLQPSQPIGIFDSGIGGLTVANAVAKELPHENFIYFGDVAHLPYGDKSASTIQRYSKNIVDFLLQKNCKLILVACNSAAAAAYDLLNSHIHNRTLFMSVIEPVIDYLNNFPSGKTIGLIGTKQTVSSEVFAKKISALTKQFQFKALATPLLVPIIEENFHQHHEFVDTALELYLSQSTLDNIDALILGCTHYPIIKSRIQKYYDNEIELLDAAELTAKSVRKLLQSKNLLNTQKTLGEKQFYVSDITPAFEQMAERFFGDTIQLQIKSLD